VDDIKEVVGISIGSSKRDHEVELELLGETVRIRREGTDGDMDKAVARIRELDGKVDAFGMGGIDLFLTAAGRDYHFRDAKRFSDAAKVTPLLDGTGLKSAVEADVIRFMREDLGLELKGKRALVTSAVDRWGMTEALYEAGCTLEVGDLLYALDIPIMMHDKRTTERVIHLLAPVVVLLPFKWLYPTEADHTTEVEAESKHAHLYRDNDIIAGDYKYVRQWMPNDMAGKWVVTNTTTAADLDFLRDRGVELIVTSTPRLEGRSFGTNVIEATLVALKGATGRLPASEYLTLMREIGFTPDARWLQKETAQ
jgi:hypothetical protein